MLVLASAQMDEKTAPHSSSFCNGRFSASVYGASGSRDLLAGKGSRKSGAVACGKARSSGTGGKNFLYECCDGIGELIHLDSEDVRVFVTEQLNVFRDHARQNILPGAFGGSWEILKNAGSWGAAILVTGVAVLLMASDLKE